MAFRRGTSHGFSTQTGSHWVERAVCRDADPGIFEPLPHAHLQIDIAISWCRRCPADVRLDCLREALVQCDQTTVRGGLTAAERKAYTKRGLAPEDFPEHLAHSVWCRLCETPYAWDEDRPYSRTCIGCAAKLERNPLTHKRRDFCAECDEFRPIAGGGKCGACYSVGRTRRVGAVAR